MKPEIITDKSDSSCRCLGLVLTVALVVIVAACAWAIVLLSRKVA